MAIVQADEGNPRGLPSGLVTFVFTDIEASTRLVKALDAAAYDIFALHNQLLRKAWTSHGGVEVHTEGDSFFVSFAKTDAAVAACVDAQRAIETAEWPGGVTVRVRMGIHAGLGAPRDDDYVALAANQASRVMSAGHGGQILITESTVDLISSVTEAQLTSLGRFRMRDFDHAVHLFRVDPDRVAPNETPIRATPAQRHNLVRSMTSFVGRDADMDSAQALLEPGRAVTLAGVGGVGKSRLASEIGVAVADNWTHGVWLVELADVLDPELVVEAIAAAIGAAPTGGSGRWDDVIGHLAERDTLLMLDNIETHIDVCARLVADLLTRCPGICVLSTGREPLNIAVETVFRVNPLDMPDDAGSDADAAPVRLFLDRATAVNADLRVATESIPAVAGICRHLDGLPLAIEIAAARVQVLSVEEILSGLGNRFRLLRSRDRSLPSRQRTMEGLLGWSYRLLTDDERKAFRRLAVFSGGFSLDAATAALASHDLSEDRIPELIWALIDKSLVVADLTESATRYRLFESVQQYGLRLLIDTDEPVRAAAALGRWFLARIGPWSVNDRRWLGEVGIELANLRGVIDLIADAEPEMAQQLVCSIGRYHDAVQSFHTGVDELTRAVRQLAAPTPTRVDMLATLADLHLRQANTAAAETLLTEASALQDTVGAPEWNDVAIERTAGELATRAGDHDRAARIATDALARDLSERGQARMWNLLGVALHGVGDASGALEAFESELAVYLSLNLETHIASAHGNVAEEALRLGDERTAAEHQRACLDGAVALGQPIMIAYSLIVASRLAGDQADWTLAMRLQAAAQTIMAASSYELHDADHEAVRLTEEQARAAIGADRVSQACAEGRSLSIFDAAELASKTLAETGLSTPNDAR